MCELEERVVLLVQLFREGVSVLFAKLLFVLLDQSIADGLHLSQGKERLVSRGGGCGGDRVRRGSGDGRVRRLFR